MVENPIEEMVKLDPNMVHAVTFMALIDDPNNVEKNPSFNCMVCTLIFAMSIVDPVNVHTFKLVVLISFERMDDPVNVE